MVQDLIKSLKLMQIISWKPVSYLYYKLTNEPNGSGELKRTDSKTTVSFQDHRLVWFNHTIRNTSPAES